jgi:hypothetical protein
MKAKTFDRKFDAAENIIEQLDLSKARRIGTEPKRVERRFSWLDGRLPRSGGAPVRRHAAVADQIMAGRQIGPEGCGRQPPKLTSCGRRRMSASAMWIV